MHQGKDLVHIITWQPSDGGETLWSSFSGIMLLYCGITNLNSTHKGKKTSLLQLLYLSSHFCVLEWASTRIDVAAN